MMNDNKEIEEMIDRLENRWRSFTKWKFYLVLGILLLVAYLMFAAAAAMRTWPSTLSHVLMTSLSDTFGNDTEKKKEVLTDAGSLAEYIREEGLVFEQDSTPLLDNKTILRVLDAVAEYNKNITARKTVYYDYERYIGEIQSFDSITGDVVVGSTFVEEEVVTTKEVTIKKKAPFTEEEVRTLYLDKGLPPPGPYAYKWVEETVEVEEVTYVQKEVPPRVETYREHVDLDMGAVDGEPDRMGENILHLNWQPVLTLCQMYVQEHSEDIGTFEEVDADGVSFYLSDADIQNAINLFSYQYSFYDDVRLYNGRDNVPFDYIKTHSAAYRLVTNPGGVENTFTYGNHLTELRVYRQPALAPIKIWNTYLDYTYQYVDEYDAEGNVRSKRLVGRKCVRNPEAFLRACEGYLGAEFDQKLYLEQLSELPEGSAMADYYRQLLSGSYESYETANVSECPAIGVRVSYPDSSVYYTYRNGEVYSGEAAWDFPAESGSTGGSTGGYVTPPWIATDELELAFITAAESCLGTPYKMGGSTPGKGIDCSGFVSYVYRQFDYPFAGSTGHGPSAQGWYNHCDKIAAESAVIGDLIFFERTYDRNGDGVISKADGITHIGIYMGDGMFIHSGDPNKYAKIDSKWFREHLVGYGRVSWK